MFCVQLITSSFLKLISKQERQNATVSTFLFLLINKLLMNLLTRGKQNKQLNF